MVQQTEATEVGLEKSAKPVRELNDEQQAIVQIAFACSRVFELVSRSVPSNHVPTINKEIAAMKLIMEHYK